MQKFITLASAAALVATASASASAFNLNDTCNESQPLARVHNRCSYPVHVWSVLKGQGCPADDGAIIEPGQFYQENYRPAVNGIGTSIKISKTSQCKGNGGITQLEYYIETEKPGFNYNYFDVSWVDCTTGDCPSGTEGFYLKSGNVNGQFKADSNNEICPIISCSDRASCSKFAYIDAYDRQTKSCDPKANIDFYMCGSEAPGKKSDKPAPIAPAASSYKAPASSPSIAAYSVQEAKAAAITPAPVQEKSKLHIKTEVVYVTKYAEAKRHEHAHRHQHFKA
ncbi:hypothetical protein BCR34DRAFT_602788 [Clohesyomyces aquaticus]|uniref:Thaumatin n=1 Tax=Clohesyomyces aquaticus TaxID=1231657 RepID=A0A1Y1ZH44_9PLEO|nr:hypothetical protein BCR34DRAFT_602788 [Clohesyomyces aquaticus]